MKIFLLIFKLARRNILRNKKRSFITSLSVGLGLAVIIFTDAMTAGFENYMRNSATTIISGEAQIHGEKFLETMQAEDTLTGYKEIIEKLEEYPGIAHYSPRVISSATVSSASDVKYIMLLGVDPEKEKELSVFDNYMTEGVYLSSENSLGILIGKNLAENLGVDSGSKIVITVAQPFTGQIYQEMFRVSGVFETDMADLNKSVALVNIEKASEMLGIEGSAHEIAVRFKNPLYAENPDNPFFRDFSVPGNKALGWKELYPEMTAIFNLSKISIAIVGFIIFFIISLGIINTMFMSIYDRIFEFGILRAIGAKRSFIFMLIAAEALFICLWSVFFGSIIGFLVTYIFSITGIDYKGIEYQNVLLRAIYPSIKMHQFIFYPVFLLFFSVLISFYPAFYASGISLTKAFKKTL
ncbi:ABC transporter permease [candidate division WOR-3 bacterium]|nr:ABC transporter permease [candidate division WOR-3 bacterium]